MPGRREFDTKLCTYDNLSYFLNVDQCCSASTVMKMQLESNKPIYVKGWKICFTVGGTGGQCQLEYIGVCGQDTFN